MPETLLILGTSVRAAAHSALRAGLRVFAVDQFGDVDLADRCDGAVAQDYPEGLFTAAQQTPPGPWMYTGGLENHARLFSQLCDRELLGVANPAPLRAPQLVSSLAQAAGLSPVIHRTAHDRPQGGKWLLKPRHSSGGWSIRIYDGGTYPPANDEHYWQPFIDGLPLSAVFVFGAHDWLCWGLTEQLSGTPWTGAKGFGYCGSIGPVENAAAQEQFLAFGEQLFATGLARGLIGVDAILDEQDRLHILEINPRYTASVELHERATGASAIALHVEACRGSSVASFAAKPPGAIHGKAVIYASEEGVVSPAFVEHCLQTNAGQTWPTFADIPRAGSLLQAAWPIVTIFASGGCAEETRFALRRGASATLKRLASM